MDGLRLDAAYGHLNLDFDDDTRSQSSPENTGTMGMQYEWNMDMGMLITRVDATYTDESYFSSTNRDVNAKDRTLLNARITLTEVELSKGQLQFALWGRNLTDEEYKVHGAGFAGYNAYTWGDPLSYGLDLTYECNSFTTLRIGYQAFWLDGLALAAENVAPTADILMSGAANIVNNGKVVYHGPRLGITCAW